MIRVFRRALTAAAALALGLTGAVIVAAPASAAGCTVTLPGDDGSDGTLRYAVETANCAGITINAGLTITLDDPITLDIGTTFTGGFGTTITRSDSFDMFEIEPAAAGAAYQFDNIVFQGTNEGRAFHAASATTAFASFTTNNVHFQNFDSGDGNVGGAVFIGNAAVDNGSVAFNVTSFTSNTAGGPGGGAYVLNASTVNVSGNGSGVGSASINEGTSGGAFSFNAIRGTVTFTNYRLVSNEATDGDGGAIELTDINGKVTIQGCAFGDLFAGNQASENGGAVAITNVVGDIDVIETAENPDPSFRGNQAEGSGGGLFINYEGDGETEIQDVFISEVLFWENDSDGTGGGASIVGAQSLRVSQSEFGNPEVDDPENAGNTSGSGGGLWFGHISGTTTILETGFHFNESNDGNGGGFGTSENGTVDVSASTFVGNTTQADGGAAYVEFLDGTATIQFFATTFDGNEAQDEGGAVYVDSIPVSLLLDTTQFTSNSAVEGSGGAVHIGIVSDGPFPGGANFTIRGSQFIDNETEGSDGGAVYVGENNEVVEIDSSTFSDNSVFGDGDGEGSALAVEENNGTTRLLNATLDELLTETSALYIGEQSVTGLLEILSSTLVSNDTAVFVGSSSGAARLTNSIFSSPAGVPALRLTDESIPFQVSYSLLSSPLIPEIAPGAGNRYSVADMKLAPLAATPGTDPTYLLTRVPLAASPALKIGDASASYLPDFDERGAAFPRVTLGGLDIGAVQTDLQPPLAATGSTGLPVWVPIVGGIVLLAGIGFVIFSVLNRRKVAGAAAGASDSNPLPTTEPAASDSLFPSASTLPPTVDPPAEFGPGQDPKA